ncbi:MAG: hypothetical protein MUF68_01900 [Cyclobacteriaceae bacterium]|jgi:hypothetical protein|nr:hypothetical protein [Cyclobacteriaceae bacterium]
MFWLIKVWRSNALIRLRHWEYWPFGIVQLPAIFYYLWLSIKARSFFFFTASNPAIEMGGLLGESKNKILSTIPERYKAKSKLIVRPVTLQQLFLLLKEEAFTYPVIFKPDLGERGFFVRRINNEEDAQQYLKEFPHDFLVQEYVELPLEFGVFYKRYPNQKFGVVFSITGKEFLSVKGNGIATLQQLILQKDRAKLQWEKLKEVWKDNLQSIPNEGEEIILNKIGNHSLGTQFTNGNYLISEKLNNSFDNIAKNIPDFYYGRFDLRCNSISDLENGIVKVVELNGCGAEPAHIYEPGYSFFKATKEIIEHWKSIYDIAIQNNKNGIAFYTRKQAIYYYSKFRNAMKA